MKNKLKLKNKNKYENKMKIKYLWFLFIVIEPEQHSNKLWVTVPTDLIVHKPELKVNVAVKTVFIVYLLVG